MAEHVAAFGQTVLRQAPILFGLGLIENAYDQTCLVKCLTPEGIIKEETTYLELARSRMPAIKLSRTDVLIVDQIGKNISGDGMDPNISGTWATPYASGGISAERVVVLDLTAETQGNSNGLGMADITTDRAFAKMDPLATYPNGLTSLILNVAKIPMHLGSDELAIKAACKTCSEGDPDRPRIIRIRNTMQLDTIWVSETLLEAVREHPEMEILSDPKPFSFDAEGNLF